MSSTCNETALLHLQMSYFVLIFYAGFIIAAFPDSLLHQLPLNKRTIFIQPFHARKQSFETTID